MLVRTLRPRLGPIRRLAPRCGAVAALLLVATLLPAASASAHFYAPGDAGDNNKHNTPSAPPIRWPWTDAAAGSRQPLHIKYSRACLANVSQVLYDSAYKAAQAWVATPTPLFFDESPGPADCSGSPRLGYVDFGTFNGPPSLTLIAQTWQYTYVPPVTSKVCDDVDDRGKPINCHTVVFPARFEALSTINYTKSSINAAVVQWNLGNGVPPPSTNGDGGLQIWTHELGHALGLAHGACYTDFSQCGISIMESAGAKHPSTPQPHDIQDINLLYPGW
jgi:hypothetical protein